MTIRSRITAQGQISVPAEIRKKLGVGPGSVLEWDPSDSPEAPAVIVKKAADFDLDDLHRGLFGDAPAVPIATDDMDDAIEAYIRNKHARR